MNAVNEGNPEPCERRGAGSSATPMTDVDRILAIRLTGTQPGHLRDIPAGDAQQARCDALQGLDGATGTCVAMDRFSENLP